MPSHLLQQVRVLDPVTETDRVADVLIVDGQIQAIADRIETIPPQTQVQDCRGCILGPGLVDLYSHSGEPGYESRETLDSLIQAAVAGGFTRLAVLPDTDPVLDHPGGIELLHQRSAGVPLQLLVWGAVTQKLEGQQLTELVELAQAGVIGFSDGQPLANLALVRRLLEYVQPLNRAIALWPWHPALGGRGVVQEGPVAIRLGLPASPAYAESVALSGLLELIAAIQTPVHLMRIATARGVAMIQAAKAQGLPITASTSWMHLLWHNEAIASYDPNLCLAPPLGGPEDQAALIQGIQSGVLDAIAIDHTPYTYEEKTVAFAVAPPGAIGLELALPLLWQRFVTPQQWRAIDLWRALSHNPAHCLGETPARIAPGYPAELTLFDPELEWRVIPEQLKSLARNTPWFGQSIKGRIRQTWCPT